MKIITIMAIALLLCSCIAKRLNTWIGQPKQNLIYSWGPPAQTADDGNGGQILVYGNRVSAPSLNLDYWDITMFYVDSDGKIYHWLKKSEQVPPTQVVITTYRR